MLRDIDVIHLGMPVDNLSVDKNGDVWAAAFPKVLQLLKSFSDPSHIDSPTSIWRIRKVQGSYVKQKVLEDAEARIVGSATVVTHDTKTGKLFIGGKSEASLTGGEKELWICADYHRCYDPVYFYLHTEGLRLHPSDASGYDARVKETRKENVGEIDLWHIRN